MRILNIRVLHPVAFLFGFSLACFAYPAENKGKSWTISTDDTRLTLSVDADQKLYISEYSNPEAGWNWTTSPSRFIFIGKIEIAGKKYSTDWQFKEATMDKAAGEQLIIKYINKNPSVELSLCWLAQRGPGPVRLAITLKNNSGHTLTIYNQESMCLKVTAPLSSPAIWYFNDMGWSKDGYGGATGEAMFHDNLSAGYSKELNFSDQSGYIPYIIIDAEGKNGIYLGCEWIFGRIQITGDNPGGRAYLKAGNGENFRTDIDDGDIFNVPPAFIGAYNGDLDESGNSLRQYLYNYSMPEIVRSEGYPKVQLNAFAAFADKPGSWNPVQDKFYSTADLISQMGFEEIMFDVGWWEGNTKILPSVPEFDHVDWSMGPVAIRNYLSYKNLRWGLYWDRPAKMTSNYGISDRITEIKYMYDMWKIDLWRSDGTAAALITQGTWNPEVTRLSFPEGSYGKGTRAHYPEDVNYWQCKGFYEVVDNLYANIDNFQWENCEGGGQITDFGTMSRCVKIQITDISSPLDMHRSFFDHLYMFHPVQLMGFCSFGEGDRKYWFRSAFMGAGNLTLDPGSISVQDKKDIKSCINTYKTKIRPLINSSNIHVYHIFNRPDNHIWTGMQYFDPTKQKGVVYIFKPDNDEEKHNIKLKGLDEKTIYKLTFEDGTNQEAILSGRELMEIGITISLQGKFVSELMFIERAL